MLGRQHLTLSVITAAILVTPFSFEHPEFSIIFLIGAAIGSLIPDVDAQDAAIFHSNIKGLNSEPGLLLNKFIGPLLPFFGYSTKYVIYKPSVHLFNFFTAYRFEERHRSFSHSLLGIITMTAFTGLYTAIPLIYLDLFTPLYLCVFLAAYLFGAFMHIIQDSCTKTGIVWNSPFSHTKLKGNLRTGKDFRKPRMMMYTLMFLVSAVIFSASRSGTELNDIFIGASVMAGLAWIVFMISSGVEIKER